VSYEFYKVLHIFAIVAGCTAIGAMALGALATRDDAELGKRLRKPLMAIHGVAGLLILVAGFGLLARTGVIGKWPPWVYGKLALWVTLGISPVLVRRRPQLGFAWVVLVPVIAGIGAWLAVTKPG